MYNYLFFFRNITIGGAELLIKKLSQKLVSNNGVTLFCENIDCDMKRDFSNIGINILEINDWCKYFEVKKYINEHDNVICVTFEWDIFLDIYSIKSYKNKRTIFYAIDYSILAFGYHRKPSLFKYVEKQIVKIGLCGMLKENCIICMDEQTVRFTMDYFQTLKVNSDSFNIVRVPIDIDAYNIGKTVNKTKDFVILSVARADFPFKGYLVGLVDFMKYTDEQTFLKIISYGKDIGILKDKIETMPLEIKQRIHLIDKVENSKLSSYYMNSDLYIGMGTTILEAAINQTIAIPVVPRTMEVKAQKFFHEDYRNVAIDETKENKLLDLYYEVRNMDLQCRQKLEAVSKELVMKHYSIEAVVEKFMNFSTNCEVDRGCLSILTTRLYRRCIRYLTSKVRKGKNNEKSK